MRVAPAAVEHYFISFSNYFQAISNRAQFNSSWAMMMIDPHIFSACP